ncbi:response regulator [Rhodobacterales bacterium HKCCE2091]|nr:response regulator [Rhodobacterales bacterium HKCCE2091]
MTPGKTVMLIDDDPDFLEAAQDGLEMLGYGVEPVGDPRAAMAAADRAAGVDVLIVDVGLGQGLSGWDVARRARAVAPGLPVVILTGNASGKEETGPDGFEVVAKTAGLMALKDALDRVTRQGG